MEPSAPKPIGLDELIYQVKRELLASPARQDDPIPLFAVTKIELEVAVSVDRAGEGGINIQVLSLGAKVSRQDAQVVRVTLESLCTREELVADLRARYPAQFERMNEAILRLLKGPEREEGPISFPP